MTTKSFDWIVHHARNRRYKLASVDLGACLSRHGDAENDLTHSNGVPTNYLVTRCCQDFEKAVVKVSKSVAFVDEIPHNVTGKVLKRTLRLSHG